MRQLEPITGHVVADEHAARVVPTAAEGPAGRVDDDGDPDSFAEVLPPLDGRDELALQRARSRLHHLLATGRFVPLEQPALVVIEVEEGGHRTRSLVGDLDVAAFDDGTVLSHEHVSPDRVDTLRRHLDAVEAVSTPVSLAHAGDGALAGLLDEVGAEPARVRLASGTGSLAVWVVDEQDRCERLARAAAATSGWLLADGHHRAAAARPTGRVLVALTPQEQLAVRPFHRRLSTSRPGRAGEVLEAAGLEVTALPGPAAPRGPGEVTVAGGGRWWRVPLRPADPHAPAGADLDVVRAERQVLAPLATASGQRRGAVPVAPRDDPGRLLEEGAVTVLLHPPTLDEVRRAASHGALPEKSTYVVPKQRPGVLVVPRSTEALLTIQRLP